MENLWQHYIVSVIAHLTVLVLVAVFGAVFGKRVWLALSGLMGSVHLPRIFGRWTATYWEPNESGEVEERSETINLHQIGRLVWGDGTVSDTPTRDFKFSGSILRNTLRGSYSRKGQKSQSGTGTFQVVIAGSDASMNGWCIWYDRDTDKGESSLYKW